MAKRVRTTEAAPTVSPTLVPAAEVDARKAPHLAKSIVERLPGDLTHHTLSFATCLDLTALHVTSTSNHRHIAAYTARALCIVDVEEAGGGRNARRDLLGLVAFRLVGLHAGSLASLTLLDPGTCTPSAVLRLKALVAETVKRCAKTLACCRIADRLHSLKMWVVLGSCTRLWDLVLPHLPAVNHLTRVVTEDALNVAAREPMPADMGLTDEQLQSLATLIGTHLRRLARLEFRHRGRHRTGGDHIQSFLTNASPDNVTDIVVRDIRMGDLEVYVLGRFVNVRRLSLHELVRDELAVLGRCLSVLTRLEWLRLALRDRFDGDLVLPSSVRTLDLSADEDSGAYGSTGLVADGLLHLSSTRCSEEAIARVLGGSRNLQTVWCVGVCGSTDDQHIARALSMRDPAANARLVGFVMEDLAATKAADFVVALARKCRNLEQLCVRMEDGNVATGPYLLRLCPRLLDLALQGRMGFDKLDFHGRDAPADARQLQQHMLFYELAAAPDEEAAVALLPVATRRDMPLERLHLYGFDNAVVAHMASAGSWRALVDVAVYDTCCGDLDLARFLNCFPALQTCVLFLGKAALLPAHADHSSSATAAERLSPPGDAIVAHPLGAEMHPLRHLELMFADADFAHLLPYIAARCGDLRHLTLVGTNLKLAVLAWIAEHPAQLPRLGTVRFCGFASSDSAAECTHLDAALARSRRSVTVLWCRHTWQTTGSGACEWNGIDAYLSRP